MAEDAAWLWEHIASVAALVAVLGAVASLVFWIGERCFKTPIEELAREMKTLSARIENHEQNVSRPAVEAIGDLESELETISSRSNGIWENVHMILHQHTERLHGHGIKIAALEERTRSILRERGWNPQSDE